MPPKLWDLVSQTPVSEALPIETLLTTSNFFSSDSTWLASFGQYTGIKLWDLSPGRRPLSAYTYTLSDHTELASAIAFSRDSTLIGTGGDDSAIDVYDLRRRTPLRILNLRRHTNPIAEVVFSPDNQWLASRDKQGNRLLWNLGSEAVQNSDVAIEIGATAEGKVYFSEDEMFIECAQSACFARYPLATSAALKYVETTVGRNLSYPEWDEFFPGDPYQKTFDWLPMGEPYPKPLEIF